MEQIFLEQYAAVTTEVLIINLFSNKKSSAKNVSKSLVPSEGV